MAGRTYTFVPDRFELSIGGYKLEGMVKDSRIRVVYDGNDWEEEEFADGDVSRIYQYNGLASVFVTLAQHSPSNAVLSAWREGDRASYAITPSLVLIDTQSNSNTTTTFTATCSWIKKLPDMEIGSGVPTYEWEIRCTDLSGFIGQSFENNPITADALFVASAATEAGIDAIRNQR
jgi:hypothetical protein